MYCIVTDFLWHATNVYIVRVLNYVNHRGLSLCDSSQCGRKRGRGKPWEFPRIKDQPLDVDFCFCFNLRETKLLIRLASISPVVHIYIYKYTYVQLQTVTWIAWSVIQSRSYDASKLKNRNFETLNGRMIHTYPICNRIFKRPCCIDQLRWSLWKKSFWVYMTCIFFISVGSCWRDAFNR